MSWAEGVRFVCVEVLRPNQHMGSCRARSVYLTTCLSIPGHCLPFCLIYDRKKVREKSRECHNHKPQPFRDPKRKRKPTNLNKHKPNKRTKSTKISSLFPKRGNRNTKRTEKHKNKMTHGKTYNKSPRRKKHKQQGVRLTPGPPP